MYIVNIIENLTETDFVFYILIVILACISLAMFYLIYSQNKEMNDELKRQRLDKELEEALIDKVENVDEGLKTERIQLDELDIPDGLEFTNSFYVNDSKELQDITKELESLPKERKIEMTPYEAEQEEKAIISYEELLSRTNSVDIPVYDDFDTLDNDFNLNKVETNQTEETVDVKKELNSKVEVISYAHEEAFLKDLKQLQQIIN